MSASSRTAAVFDALHQPPHSERTPQGLRVTVRLPVERAAAQMAGHYPGFPILPGVLLIEGVRQAAGAALGGELQLCRVDRARFVRPLFAGDELQLSLLVTSGPDSRITVRARGARADGLMAAELSLTLEAVVAGA
ncbi:3-hydroxyacyl-ACP dehydratase FabZ family protein [Streptomyces sp. NPDC020802]|uniref:3-hydroxyacyl-ACP dehydratase FabZ family protein n=1 Tax=Streptomyces sp. NPDC020802 TaxID=3365094 RepID=UPI003791D03C